MLSNERKAKKQGEKAKKRGRGQKEWKKVIRALVSGHKLVVFHSTERHNRGD